VRLPGLELATEIMVRSLGIPQVTPPLRSFFDIPEMMGGYDGSAVRRDRLG